jgi:hypothetical protein
MATPCHTPMCQDAFSQANIENWWGLERAWKDEENEHNLGLFTAIV